MVPAMYPITNSLKNTLQITSLHVCAGSVARVVAL